MTLIAVMMNAQYAVQVSDRALSENGALLPTTLTKGSVLTCDDARLLVGFTGLAQVGSFQTTPWLLTTLSDLAHRSHRAVDICKRFVDAATETFRRDARVRRLPAEARRMTFIFTGFRYLERDRYQPVSLLVTNFQDWDRGYDDPGAWREFKPLYITPRRDIDWDEFAYVERIGAWPALGEREVAPIRRLVKERRPPAAAVGKAVEVLRKAADHPSCRGSVSKDLVSVVLPANPEWDPSSVFHPVAASEVTYFPNFVDARQGGGMTAWGIEFRVESGGPPVAVPKVGRNEPCRCGSGKKYKRCHGR